MNLIRKIIDMKPLHELKQKLYRIWLAITFTAALALVSAILTGCTRNTEPISRTGFYFDTVIQITLYDTADESVLDGCFALAEKYENKELILFGSRARGEYYRTSDIDLAVSGGNIDRFSLSVDEETSTLLKFDHVNLDRAVQPGLRESIMREGIKIYEKI